jgi:SSS family solute:Na+ symporter
MSATAVCLAITFAIIAAGAGIGFLAGVRRRMDLEQWTVAGRGFGGLLVFLLMAGEVYTTFAFLGVSGWTYSRGGPTLYALAYLTLAYVVSFFILPPVWELGRRHGLQTQSDFFRVRFGSRYLTAFVWVASFDTIGRTPAMSVAVVLLVGFVFAGGVRAVAWVSVLKDVLMLTAAVAIGIGVPLLCFGGIGPMFAALAAARPTHLTMPGATTNLGHGWYVSAVLLSSLGFYMWPHYFAAAFTARNADTLRRNAVVRSIHSPWRSFSLPASLRCWRSPVLPTGTWRC